MLLKTKWNEHVEMMDDSVFWALPPEVRDATLVEVDGEWKRLVDTEDEADSDLAFSLTRTE